MAAILSAILDDVTCPSSVVIFSCSCAAHHGLFTNDTIFSKYCHTTKTSDRDFHQLHPPLVPWWRYEIACTSEVYGLSDSSSLKREPTLQDYSHLHEHLPRISFSSLSCNDSPAVQKYLSFRKKSIYQIANSRQHTLT